MSWKRNPDKTPEENSRMFQEAVKAIIKERYEEAIKHGLSEKEATEESVRFSL